MDTDLEVVVEVEGNCETITPSVDFINPEIRELAHIIYQAGYPRDLLYLQEDTDIKYDDNQYLNYDPEKPFYGQTLAGFYSKIEDKEYGYYQRSHSDAEPDIRVFQHEYRSRTEKRCADIRGEVAGNRKFRLQHIAYSQRTDRYHRYSSITLDPDVPSRTEQEHSCQYSHRRNYVSAVCKSDYTCAGHGAESHM